MPADRRGTRLDLRGRAFPHRRPHLPSLLIGLAVAATLAGGCATTPAGPAGKRQFYQNPHVRQCLQYEKEQKATGSRECWSRLLRRIEAEPGFRDENEFLSSDVAKVRRHLAGSTERTDRLAREYDACLNLPARPRKERIACFQAYLERNRALLSRTEAYEVDNAISALEQAREREAGEVEATVEHAGKLLGLALHEEEDGLRIDAVSAGPLAAAGVPEQGVVVALDGVLATDLSSTERIAHLEACQERPVTLLIRHGEVAEIVFVTVEVSCAATPVARQLSHHALPPEICTAGAASPELALGVSWCYRPRFGLLEVEEVCTGSPADRAGLKPEQRLVRINDRSLLGASSEEIAALLGDLPVRLTAMAGALASPAPLTGPRLTAEQRTACWQAIEATLAPGPPAR